MACKEGYQVGAKKFADYYGISLMELRAPKDGETMIGVLDIKWNINVTHQLYLVDEEWAAKHGYIFVSYREWLDYRRIKRDNKWSKSTHLPLNTSDDYIRDEKGNVITSIEYLKKREPDNKPNDNTIIYCLKDSYVQTRDCGLVKINEVMFEDEHLVKENTYSLDAGYFVRAILEDALGGEKMMIL